MVFISYNLLVVTFFNTHSEEYVRHTVGSTIDYSNTDRPQVRNATTVV